MDGILDKFGKAKHKPKQSMNSTSPKTRTVKRILSIKPKSNISHKQIITNNSTFEPGAAEIHFAQDQAIPPKDEVNQLFNNMLERRGIHDPGMKQSMEKWGIEKKWLMINQELQAELLVSGGLPIKGRGSMESKQPLPSCSNSSDEAVQPQKSISTPTTTRLKQPTLHASQSTLTSTSPGRSKSTSPRTKKDHFFHAGTLDHHSPEFFIRKFLDPNLRSVTTPIAARLEVSLRTRSIDWVAKFIQLKGYHVLSYALDYLNHTNDYRRDVPLELEVEIIKCIKAIMNTKIGKQETMDHPEYIHTVVFSILCPHWQTRKIVCELLAFLCYSDGYEHVVRGFEILKKFRKDLGLFDSWMRDFERTIEDGGHRIPGNHLIDYALSNMILVNAVVKVPGDANDRIYMGNQFNASGIQSILPKLKALEHELLDIQIDAYKDTLDADMDEAFGEDLSLYSDISQPSELFERVIESISEAPRASEQFMSLLKHLLWIHGDSDTKYYYYRMIQIIVQQIVMDQRPHENTESFSSTFGIAVGAVIQSYCELERLKGIEPELENLKVQYESVAAEKEQLQAEIAKLRIQPAQLEFENKNQRINQLREENDSLRGLLRTSKETIAMLQGRLPEENLQKEQVSEVTPPVKSPGKLGKGLMNSGSSMLGNLFSPLFNKKLAANRKTSLDTRSIDRGAVSTEALSTRGSAYSSCTSSDKISLPTPPGAITPPSAPTPPPPPPPLPSVTLSTPNAAPNSISTPPPPPPPSLGGATPNVPVPPLLVPARKELHHYPQVKLKNLQWQKMDARATCQTFWDTNNHSENLEEKLNEKGVFDTIECLFPAKVNHFLEKRLQSKKTDVENDSIKFLKKDKSRNINIAILPQIKQLGSFKATQKHILAVDDKLCTETFLVNLITNIPNNDDDLVTMQKYMSASDEECLKLDLPEQFTIEMMKIYRYEARLKYMLFRAQFWERFDRLKSSLSIVLGACDALHDSEAFKELLSIILMLGNYMNASSLQGGAFGFRIASINKLVDTKATESSHLTLLHILAGIIRKQFPHILKFIEDVKDVPQAARIMSSISDIVKEYTDMRQGLKQLGIELDTYWKETQVDSNQDRFYAVMEQHRRSVTERFEEIEALYINMDAKWKNLMLYYGENPQSMRPDEFFQIFSRFVHNWKTCAYEELVYAQSKEREEKRIRELEEKRLQKTKNMTKSNDDEGPLVDDLLAKLRSGESLTKSRKNRARRKTRQFKKSQSSSSVRSGSSVSSCVPSISAEALLRNLQEDE